MKKSKKYIYKELQVKSNIIYFELLLHYMLIISVFTLLSYSFKNFNLFLNSFVIFFSYFIVGWCQFSISNAFHEAIHFNFGKKHNDLLSFILTAYPIFMTISYRNIHMNHHKFFGDRNKDPDFIHYNPFPESKSKMLNRFVYNISGLSAISQFIKMNFDNNSIKPKGEKFELFKLAIVQFFISVIFIFYFRADLIFEGVLVYLFLWIFPLVSIVKFLSSTRLLCEHGSPENKLTQRTITGNFFSTYILGSFKFNYHAEHHIKAFIPYTNLKKAKPIINGKTLRSDIYYDEYENGYIPLLIKWYKNLPWK